MPERCQQLLEGADLILHTGDFVEASVLADLRSLAPVAAVRGNVDSTELRAELPARLIVETEGLRVGLVHSGAARAGRHERLRAWFPGCDAVAYGHSHEPELVRSEGVWFLNPGSPTDRRRAPTHTMIVIEAGVPKSVDLGP